MRFEFKIAGPPPGEKPFGVPHDEGPERIEPHPQSIEVPPQVFLRTPAPHAAHGEVVMEWHGSSEKGVRRNHSESK